MIDYQDLRVQLDHAITYEQDDVIEALAREGVAAAHQDENIAELLYFLSQLEIVKERFDLAIPMLTRVLLYNPNDGAAYNDRALCFVEYGLFDKALLDFDQGMKSEPDYATIRHNKGWLLNKLGYHQKAVKYFEQALALDPDRAVTYENLADVYYHLGLKSESIKCLRAAIRLLKDDYFLIKYQLNMRLDDLLRD